LREPKGEKESKPVPVEGQVETGEVPEMVIVTWLQRGIYRNIGLKIERIGRNLL
jgi:hypothetical protein